MKDGDTPVSDEGKAADSPVKRTDVGYKRPPREHQFKKGEKPPPRKKKEAHPEIAMSEIMRRVLGEERRVVVAGKARWLTGADLVMMRAWQEAEKGSATLQREIMLLLLSVEAPAPDLGPLVITDPSAPASETDFRLRPIDETES